MFKTMPKQDQQSPEKKRLMEQTRGSDQYAAMRQMASLMGNQAMLGMMQAQGQYQKEQPPFFDDMRKKYGQKQKPERQASPARQSSGGTSLPDYLREKFEKKSGLPMDDVRVHYNSDKPAELGALAYTQGTDVHVGPGQEEHLEHELVHVAQQKQGIVRPSLKINGLDVNDSPELEQTADQGNGRFKRERTTYQIQSPETKDVVQMKMDDYINEDRIAISTFAMFCIQYIIRELSRKRSEIEDLPTKLDDYTQQAIREQTSFESFVDEFIKRFNEIANDAFDTEEKQYIANSFFQLATSVQFANKLATYQDIAQKVYQGVEANEYPTSKTQYPRKLFLERLGTKEREKKIAKKISSKSGESIESADLLDLHRAQKPILLEKSWSTAINDAFVGSGIDYGFRFKVGGLSDVAKRRLAEISLMKEHPDKKVEMFRAMMEEAGYGENLVNPETEPYKYTILAREIEQLLRSGYVFCVHDSKHKAIDEEDKEIKILSAFKSEETAMQYTDYKRRRSK